MDTGSITLLQQSCGKVRASDIEAAETFYAELFAIDPSLRSMFSSNMHAQYRKFLSALNYLIYALHAPEKMQGSVQKLAEAHSRYGVRPEHYTSFGIALLRTLKKVLGPEFTPELCDAWADWFQMIARAMQEAAPGDVPLKVVDVAWWRSLLTDGARPLALAQG